jgi:hypothetical protein
MLKILQDNQGGGEVTQIDHLAIIGTGTGTCPCPCLEFLNLTSIFYLMIRILFEFRRNPTNVKLEKAVGQALLGSAVLLACLTKSNDGTLPCMVPSTLLRYLVRNVSLVCLKLRKAPDEVKSKLRIQIYTLDLWLPVARVGSIIFHKTSVADQAVFAFGTAASVYLHSFMNPKVRLFRAVFRIRINLIRIQIQHFKLITGSGSNPDPGI